MPKHKRTTGQGAYYEFCSPRHRTFCIYQYHLSIHCHRPNTMNNFGFMLSELGFDGYFDDFVTHVLDNLRARFLPAWGKLDSHHAFTIGYG